MTSPESAGRRPHQPAAARSEQRKRLQAQEPDPARDQPGDRFGPERPDRTGRKAAADSARHVGIPRVLSARSARCVARQRFGQPSVAAGARHGFCGGRYAFRTGAAGDPARNAAGAEAARGRFIGLPAAQLPAARGARLLEPGRPLFRVRLRRPGEVGVSGPGADHRPRRRESCDAGRFRVPASRESADAPGRDARRILALPEQQHQDRGQDPDRVPGGVPDFLLRLLRLVVPDLFRCGDLARHHGGAEHYPVGAGRRRAAEFSAAQVERFHLVAAGGGFALLHRAFGADPGLAGQNGDPERLARLDGGVAAGPGIHRHCVCERLLYHGA